MTPRPVHPLTAVTAGLVLLAVAALALGQAASVVNGPHNLSALGPGSVRATSEEQVCIFCHTPHNAAPIAPLWNRNVPVSAYTVYSSNSLDAAPGQPTGSSKLCLSCHDGTIAVGSVVSRGQPIQMAGGITTLPPGSKGNLGTDLSDDHPVSFVYDATLSTRDPKLKPPGMLAAGVRLDANGELQCTTCHNPHDNRFGAFLVMDNARSQLCASCHQPGHTGVAGHDGCGGCHQPHTAPSGAYLLRGRTVGETCVSCHGGDTMRPQGPNVAVALNQVSRHDTDPSVTVREHAPTDVTCNDCHESHTMNPGAAVAPTISPRLGAVAGVNAAGVSVPRAQYQYEVCQQCHADRSAVQPRITRQVVQANVRLEFAPSAVSYHPVQQAGRNTDAPSLRPELSVASMIYCTDCHASAASAGGGAGTGAKGPHGSNVSPLLAGNYETADETPESAAAYELCYRCHDRTSILANESFSGHARHVVDNRTPCSACHDAHGISSAQGTPANHSHLMNFDTTIVRPDPVTGRLEFVDAGSRSGTCFLSCHGVPHSPKSYP